MAPRRKLLLGLRERKLRLSAGNTPSHTYEGT